MIVLVLQDRDNIYIFLKHITDAFDNCHESGYHSLQLHITHGLHLPSCTAHTHIPVHHYTNHTAVTIHSLVLIASPHLHLILTLTFKQHSHLHSLRSLVSPWLHFRAYFPVCLSVHYLDCWPPLLIVCCLPLWPRLFYGNPLCLLPALTHCSASVFDSAFSTLPSIPLLDICLFDLVQIKLLVDLLSPLTCHLLQ